MKTIFKTFIFFGLVSCVKWDLDKVGAIVIDTPQITDVSPNSATIKFAFRTNNVYTITETGICYGTNSMPTINNNKLKSTVSQEETQISLNAVGLNGSTKYYARGYVIDADGKVFYSSNATNFTTKLTLPGVSTTLIDYTANIVNISGNINVQGTGGIVEAGVYYSKSTDLTGVNRMQLRV